jgi:hypothetical protein
LIDFLALNQCHTIIQAFLISFISKSQLSSFISLLIASKGSSFSSNPPQSKQNSQLSNSSIKYFSSRGCLIIAVAQFLILVGNHSFGSFSQLSLW